MDSLNYLRDVKDSIQFLHQSGEDYKDIVEEAYRKKGFRATVLPFINDMADAYAVSDIVISRAGAMTISELTACGKPSILIPYPYAAKDHQRYNAEELGRIGAAEVLTEEALSGKILAMLLKKYLYKPDELHKMGEHCKGLAKTDASDKIVRLILSITEHSE
ncbi:MAG: hypothetical protein D6828_02465 [Nitrospirae bacterium]|nr:MAG: hypothetical protein D6828_02465 [Nitrospirota bacterium]